MFFGATSDRKDFANIEKQLVEEYGIPISELNDHESDGPEPADAPEPKLDSAAEAAKIKSLITSGQGACALEATRALNDPAVFKLLLEDCVQGADEEGRGGWINKSSLFENNDALMYQLIAYAPEDAQLPQAFSKRGIENIWFYSFIFKQ